MENAPLRIIVDDRERADGKVLAALAARDDVTVEIARLEVGDYRVERRVVVERKTAADFAASLIDGRLFQQAAALALAPERAVLALEGRDQEWRDTGVRREALQGALITIGVFFGVAVCTPTRRRRRRVCWSTLGGRHSGPRRADCRGRDIVPGAGGRVSSFFCRACPASARSAPPGSWRGSARCRPLSPPQPTNSRPLTASATKPRIKMRWAVQEPVVEYTLPEVSRGVIH